MVEKAPSEGGGGSLNLGDGGSGKRDEVIKVVCVCVRERVWGELDHHHRLSAEDLMKEKNKVFNSPTQRKRERR